MTYQVLKLHVVVAPINYHTFSLFLISFDVWMDETVCILNESVICAMFTAELENCITLHDRSYVLSSFVVPIWSAWYYYFRAFTTHIYVVMLLYAPVQYRKL